MGSSIPEVRSVFAVIALGTFSLWLAAVITVQFGVQEDNIGERNSGFFQLCRDVANGANTCFDYTPSVLADCAKNSALSDDMRDQCRSRQAAQALVIISLLFTLIAAIGFYASKAHSRAALLKHAVLSQLIGFIFGILSLGIGYHAMVSLQNKLAGPNEEYEIGVSFILAIVATCGQFIVTLSSGWVLKSANSIDHVNEKSLQSVGNNTEMQAIN